MPYGLSYLRKQGGTIFGLYEGLRFREDIEVMTPHWYGKVAVTRQTVRSPTLIILGSVQIPHSEEYGPDSPVYFGRVNENLNADFSRNQKDEATIDAVIRELQLKHGVKIFVTHGIDRKQSSHILQIFELKGYGNFSFQGEKFSRKQLEQLANEFWQLRR